MEFSDATQNVATNILVKKTHLVMCLLPSVIYLYLVDVDVIRLMAVDDQLI